MEFSERYRFFAPDLAKQGQKIRLPEDQAHHARSVLRLEPGEKVILFDGNGHWAEASLEEIHKARATAQLAGALHTEPPPRVQLTIATAIPKADRAEWLIEQASQLNVTAVKWLTTDRGVVKPREGGQKIEKWRRLAVESAKQCGRTHLLAIQEPASLESVLQEAKRGRILWLDPRPGGNPVHQAIPADFQGEVVAIVGPEGGWSPREWSLLERPMAPGAIQRVILTQTVLRIETACAAIAAILMSR